MTEPKLGDIVRYKKCSSNYKIIDKCGAFWLKKVDNGNEYTMPHKCQLVLVSRPVIGMDTSGFDALGKLDEKSPSNNDAIDALAYASMHKGSFDISNEGAEAIVGRFHGTYPHMKSFLSKLNNKENKMSISINSLVAKVTDSIEDAELVTKYFGHELVESSIKDEFFVRDNYEALLEEAKARQEKADALLEKSCG